MGRSIVTSAPAPTIASLSGPGSQPQAQRFPSAHPEVYNLLNLGRHCTHTENILSSKAIAAW